MASAARDEMIGAQILGRYRVVARLGQGGMGVVYLARAEGAAGFAKPVVVKRMITDFKGDDQNRRLFVREAKILASMQHPNIVTVIDFGEEDGAYIMVLDYVRAYDLDRWHDHRVERREYFPLDALVYIMTKVLDALSYAHGLDIIHSDVSPNNILVDTEGHVKLLDFGIARMKGASTQASASKSVRGKIPYLPLEALDGSPPTVATDVYACAVTLYELLVGENPFVAVDETRTVAKIISTVPPAASTLRPDVPPELDAILAQGMAKEPAKRFASAKDFARELRKVTRMPEDEAVSLLASLAKVDYAAMPAKPGTSIPELEHAWKNPPDPGSVRVTPASIKNSSPSPFADTQIDPTGKKKSGALLYVGIIGMIGVLGAAIAGIVMLLRRESSEGPKIVLVEHDNANSQPSSTTSTSGSTDTPPSSSSSVAASASAPSQHHSGPAAADPLSGALAKNQSAIEACFRDHAADLSGSPEVSVRFTIDKSGAVQKADLTPPDLGKQPLGECLLGIARATKFPPQNQPSTTFRIPLRARKRDG